MLLLPPRAGKLLSYSLFQLQEGRGRRRKKVACPDRFKSQGVPVTSALEHLLVLLALSSFVQRGNSEGSWSICQGQYSSVGQKNGAPHFGLIV